MLFLALPLLITIVEASVLNPARTSNFTVTDEAWFDVRIHDYPEKGETFSGKFTVALFGETSPITVMNFMALTLGYTRGPEKLHYKGTPVHRVVPDFIIQMGDITVGDGTGGKSIYAPKFNDEPFTLSHRGPGWVAMANHGPDTNGSQFYILLQKARWLDGKHVVFGKVIRGYDVIKTIGDLESDMATARPKKKVTIADCGLNKLEKSYTLKADELDLTEDL
ncbi:uncharacterized protein LOC141906387 isoform X1 [Tubulanus polymorphus]|uniref:uncharacterized protein LOC141906387 isoform X1 n=1 Tax=Tubulanus polymorphus TaxID=672921 RepID=UPI003DA444E9